MCGTLAWRHWGQTLRAGTDRLHALARRLRDLDFEVFFLGTATNWRSYTLLAPGPAQGRSGPAPLLGEAGLVTARSEHVEAGPPGVDEHLVALARGDVEVGAAQSADPPAVLPA